MAELALAADRQNHMLAVGHRVSSEGEIAIRTRPVQSHQQNQPDVQVRTWVGQGAPAVHSPWDAAAAVAKKSAVCRAITIRMADPPGELPEQALLLKMRKMLEGDHSGFSPLLGIFADVGIVGFRQCVWEFYYHGGWYRPT